ncbi:phosphatidylinositol N-acetylglucosaminyltransferase subunit gpi1 [Geranomyces variabilis]|nr:phosphatidylinositol N-acetylglucosaminyltransferase subunit gpi1 [Geranomyces variabilis]
MSSNKLSTLAQARYIGFYNTVWLIANDVIVGIAFGTMLIEHCERFADWIDCFIAHDTIGRARNMIMWLMGSPGGLKLNAELNSFLGSAFLYLIHLWSGWTEILRPNLQYVVSVIGMSGIFGVSMCLSLFMDLFSLVTLHLHLCYAVASKIYYWQVKLIVSLFTLFRGKRKNVEKKRIDSAEYTLDQLLLGTILFTLLIFLFPTVTVYYTLFSMIRMAVVLVHAVQEVFLGIVNHFPLFAIMLRLKDPKRLPG